MEVILRINFCNVSDSMTMLPLPSQRICEKIQKLRSANRQTTPEQISDDAYSLKSSDRPPNSEFQEDVNRVESGDSDVKSLEEEQMEELEQFPSTSAQSKYFCQVFPPKFLLHFFRRRAKF